MSWDSESEDFFHADCYVHVKRGSTYSKIGVAELQSFSPVVEGVPLVIYKSIKDGRLWARPEQEFNDGRFIPIFFGDNV